VRGVKPRLGHLPREAAAVVADDRSPRSRPPTLVRARLVRAQLMLALGLITAHPTRVAAQSLPDSILSRPVTLVVRGAPLADALLRLRHDHGIPLAWSGDVLPPDARVTLSVRGESLGVALRALLTDTGLGFTLTRQGTVVIVPAAGRPSLVPPAATGVDRVRFATGVPQLDRIVIMGTPVAGGPHREQPTAVSVLDRRAVEGAPQTRLSDLVRAFLPGVVLWDRGPAGPPSQFAAVRGLSSFTTRGLKTYVDGIELASPELFTLVDAGDIERVEVLPGPQGAALYGPDALNGVMQIVTRKGRVGTGMTARARAAGGAFDRPDLGGESLWQEYHAALGGGATASSFEVAGSLARTGSSGGVPWHQRWTAQAGGRALLGSVLVSGTARAGRHEYGAERPTGGTGATAGSVPQNLSEQGAGVTITHAAGSRWRQTLVAGVHRAAGEREPGGSILLTPRLPLGATHEVARRISVRYSGTVDLPLGAQEASIAGGAEYGHRRVERRERRAAPATDLRPLYDDDLHSTGAFAQARLRLVEGLVLSGGGRAEWLSSVGQDAGPGWAGTAGASWARPLGPSRVLLRAAWGHGIRPPEPGMSRAMAASGLRQEANPDLRPESQSGVEAGAELYVGTVAVVRITLYDQTAEDLIQQVQRRSDATERVYQFQNLGAIGNRGVELEAGVSRGPLTVSGALHLNRSRVTRLAASYTGDLLVGDEPPEVPAGVGAMRIQYRAGRISAEAGASWLGPWTGYDWAAALSAQPERGTDRDYWIEYPGGFRPWIAGWLTLGRGWRALARVDNPGNVPGPVRTNVFAPTGRLVVVGVAADWR
jgi:iron complex outermembrane receptor protein